MGMPGMACTSDPALKCHIDGCQMIGIGICHWDNCCLLTKNKGGCGGRVCEMHRFRPHIVQMGNNRNNRNYNRPPPGANVFICVKCADECNVDIAKNKKCGLAICGVFVFIMCIAIFIPMMTISSSY